MAIATPIHWGTADCPACDPIRKQLAERGLPTCIGWQRVDRDAEDDGDVAAGCRDCGGPLPVKAGRGRPAVRCEACRSK